MLYFFLYYFNSALFLHFVVLTRIVVETRIINIISSRVVSNANFLKTSSTEVNQRLNIGIKNPVVRQPENRLIMILLGLLEKNQMML